MLGEFHPSVHLDNIYNLMADYDENLNQYSEGVINVIINYLENTAKIEYRYCCTDWLNEWGGVCSIAFVDENGYPQLVCFDYLRD